MRACRYLGTALGANADRQRGGLAGLGALPLIGLAALLWLWPAGSANASGAVAVLCGTPAPSSGATIDYWGIEINVVWSLGSYNGTDTYPITGDADLDGDLVNDFHSGVGTQSTWAKLSETDLGGGLYSTSWESAAIKYLQDEGSYIDELLAAGYPLDLGALRYQSVTSTNPNETPTGNQLGYDPSYIKYEVTSVSDLAWPAGEITMTITVPWSDGASDVYTYRLTAASSWPEGVRVTTFMENGGSLTGLDRVLGVGLETLDATGTAVPWPDLAVDVEAPTFHGEPTYTAMSLSADNGGDTAAGGFPGAMAAGMVADCDTNTNWFGEGYDQAIVTAAPAVTDAHVEVYGNGDVSGNGILEPATERTTYADVNLQDAPSLMSAHLSDADADVDGDGVLDGVDLDGDGAADGLPWSRIAFRHSGETTPVLRGVLASQPDGTTSDGLYMAVQDFAIPPNVSVDYAGDVIAVDTDGDTIYDATERSFLAADAEMCVYDWTTYNADPNLSGCTTPATSAQLDFRVRDALPAPGADGTLPAEFAALGAAPADLTATDGGHFDLSPDSYVVGRLDESAGTLDFGGSIDGITGVRYRAIDELSATVTSAGGGNLAVEGYLTDADGSLTHLWTDIAVMPAMVRVELDDEPVSVDGDPVVATLTSSGETGAAIGLDAMLPADDYRQAHLSAWIGSGDGTTDGIPVQAEVSVDLEGDGKSVAVAANSRMQFEAGFSTSTNTQRLSVPSLVTRGRVGGSLPTEWQVYWSQDDENLDRADFTCGPRDTCVVENLFATITNDVGVVDQNALAGVPMVKIPSNSGVFPNFSTYADYANLVYRGDPAVSQEGGAPGPGLTTWGLDLRVAELTTFAVDRQILNDFAGNDLFVRTDACLTATTTGANFGLGLYADRGPNTSALWLDANDYRGSTTDLDLQIELNTPSPDSAGVIGDLDPGQLAVAQALPSDYALAEVVQAPCEDMRDHTSDPAPGGSAQDDTFSVTELTARLRVGTAPSMEKVRDLLGSLASVPAADGIDATFYSGDLGQGTSFQGLDAAARISLPGWLELYQPLALRCGAGNQDPGACLDMPAFEGRQRTDINLRLASNSFDPLGDLDVNVLGEPAEFVDVNRDNTDDRSLTDALATRIEGHLDRLPSSLTVVGSIGTTVRDSSIDVDLTVTDNYGSDIGLARLVYENDYEPARLGDEDESGTGAEAFNGNQPLLDFELWNIGPTLQLNLDVSAPSWGFNRQPYDDSDCQGWTFSAANRILYPNHTYPRASNPANWNTNGPRDPSELRQPYLHGHVDLDGGESVMVHADARADETPATSSDYNEEARSTIKIAVETGSPSEGDLNGLYPGLQQYVDSRRLGGLADLESCIDIDVPVHVTWEEATRLSIGVDAPKATLAMLEAELDGGAVGRVVIEEEMFDSGGGATTALGVWAEELLTRWQVAGTKFYTNVQGERKEVPTIDPERTSIFRTTQDPNAFDMATARDGSWQGQGLDEGDEYHGGVLLDLLFHPDVEDAMLNFGIVANWSSLWDIIDDQTDYVLDATCFFCGGGAGDYQRLRWTYPELLDTTTVDGSDVDTTAKKCTGETSGSFDLDGRLADGTTFSLEFRWGGGARLELFFVGRYDNGELRFYRELFDQDLGAASCNRWRFDYDLDLDDNGRIMLDLQVERGKGRADDKVSWTEASDHVWVFDASGSGRDDDGNLGLTASDTTPAAGDTVTFSGGGTASSGGVCVYYAGDGTRTEGDTTFEYTYTLKGTYHVMQLCYSGDPAPSGATAGTPSVQDIFPTSLREVTITVS